MLVLLVGFVYSASPGEENNGYRELPGNYVDLHSLYTYFSHLTSRIRILTDLEFPQENQTLRKAVHQGTLGQSVLGLSQAARWAESLSVYRQRSDLDNFLSQSRPEPDENVFVYFSGHCFNGNIILPDLPATMASLDFRRALQENTAGSQFFFMFDCCHADGTGLPWVWKENMYTYIPGRALVCRKTICFCSTTPTEDSGSKIGGSLFTRCFLNQLTALIVPLEITYHSGEKEEKKKILLSDLVVRVNKECDCNNQTATLYASLPNLKKIWPWLYKRDESPGSPLISKRSQ